MSDSAGVPRCSPRDYALLAVIILAAALCRGLWLGNFFPVLIDESIYLRWAEIIEHQGEWFVSLLDGKPPLTYWLYRLIRAAGSQDYLLVARMVSVAAGLASTWLMFRIGWRLGGRAAAHLAAGMYAVFPYAVLYERIAYTEAFVNLAGLALTLASIALFARPIAHWSGILGVGALLGLGLWCKPTFWLFAPCPALACLVYHRGRAGELPGLYGLAGVFVVALLLLKPTGPMFEAGSAFVHRTDFFVPWAELRRHPLTVLPLNAGFLASCCFYYVTVPVLVIAALALAALRRSIRDAIVPLCLCVGPLLAQVALLRYFPTRYAFPHLWPVLLVIALGCARAFHGSIGLRAAGGVGALAALASLSYASVALLRDPEKNLHPADSVQFLGSHPYAGFGSAEAIRVLEREAVQQRFTLLTDPFWGPPADVMFVYLHGRRGIVVYEAWWLELPGRVHIVPAGPIYTMKSHYQRVPDEMVDFAAAGRVLYVTHAAYFTKEEVLAREPSARLLAEFRQPNGSSGVCIYELRNGTSLQR